jgi:hypothetical protein
MSRYSYAKGKLRYKGIALTPVEVDLYYKIRNLEKLVDKILKIRWIED